MGKRGSFINFKIIVTKYSKILLQSVTGITKCDKKLLKSVISITKWGFFYKVRRNAVEFY